MSFDLHHVHKGSLPKRVTQGLRASKYEFGGFEIDYILCSRRWRRSIQSAKTRLGADCGSDHELLIAKLGLKFCLLTCLLENLYGGQEATVRTGHGNMELRKEYIKTIYYHPTYLTYMQSTSYEMLGWMKHKLKSRLWGEISVTSDMHPYGRKRRGTKKPLDKSERGE